MNWKLAGCLLLSWIIVLVCLIRGIASLGKVSTHSVLTVYSLSIHSVLTPCSFRASITFWTLELWERLVLTQYSLSTLSAQYSLSTHSLVCSSCAGIVPRFLFNTFTTREHSLGGLLLQPQISMLKLGISKWCPDCRPESTSGRGVPFVTQWIQFSHSCSDKSGMCQRDASIIEMTQRRAVDPGCSV